MQSVDRPHTSLTYQKTRYISCQYRCMRRRQLFALSGSVLFGSGCLGQTENQHSPSETPTSADPPSSTPKPVGTGRNPSDLVAVNQTDTSQTLSLHISKRGESSAVLDETVRLDPSDRQRWNIFQPDVSGTFVITATLNDTTEQSYEWDLSEKPEDGWVSIYVESDDTLWMTYAIA